MVPGGASLPSAEGAAAPGARAERTTALRSSGRGQDVVRRLIVFVILYALVVIAAIGLAGLLERAIGAGTVMVAGNDGGLARSLAFTLIAAPLAALLWWWERRHLADPGERSSLAWTLYLAAISLTALIVTTVAVATAANAGIDGEWRPGDLSAGVVWLGVWIWHGHLRRASATAPTRLAGLTVQLSALYGLTLAASGAISALAELIARALIDVSTVLVQSQQWITGVLQALVWCLVGALVWWWHWFREGAKDATAAFPAVLLVLVVGAAEATTLFGVGSTLFAVLRALLGTDPPAEALSALDVGVAAALIGALIWVYHARVLAGRSVPVQRAGRLVVSAIALIGAASGFGVVINALLGTLSGNLVDSDPRIVLLGGISALVVGAPVWWSAWHPERPVTAGDAADPARRVYLIALFGASAIVAIVTLLVIGYRLFEFGLDPTGARGLIERVRAPLGLLCATALVFAYHFAIWRRDRTLAGSLVRPDSIGRLILVTGGDAGELARLLRAETGAPVTVWRAADAGAHLGSADAAAVLESLQGVTAPRVLVIAETGGGARVVPLAD
ncbi:MULTISPECIES: DUF5671 domain-containing protein [unclassified Microbacterium]|uniref:DUF5671 domain-containing protein n=1 Tax=unclassified Microbacterium TaxID=2609290 RepID=UPI00214B8A4C|nr:MULTISPECIES: DUF5671 domain-containing protein [unclassified Microbacterium]MCR2811364.1 DUF5671 domain-containing protein [Microbacterium sp. zg.B185]WIM20878.1 DUF5671 domain-containing protein [Microbacterium sp. zg-B185]